MIDLIEGNGQNQSLGTPFEVLSFNLSFFLFKSFFYVLILFLGFVYAYICLCSLVLCLFGVFKHIRLLDLIFQVLLCFFFLSVFWVKVQACLYTHTFECSRRLKVCVHVHLAYVRRPMYAHIYSCPKILILIFLFLLCWLFYLICLCFILCSHVYLSLYARLGFIFLFLNLNTMPFIHMPMHWCHRS